ncbi:hypothetical protein [Roseateles amylovorans]|jgi:hypothetical protein|uniref:Uncharacterized protein n=1 Tax=Roseateles amylovorans TaxID=2978473 RepID=A0ABY6B3A4_9BURK|nr:hypothetical protein [Roseateles amylovorans]UXH78454.1 hypothetical protein N4261_00480 [Roseateles amylovorans]
MASFQDRIPTNMWRVVFYERRGNRVHVDRTGPWLPEKTLAQHWARWFTERGYHVALQDQGGQLEKSTPGLPS